MKLPQLLEGCGAEIPTGSASVDVKGVSQDSRSVKPGDLFVAVPGGSADGAQYAQEAISKGAVAVLAEKKLPVKVPCAVTTTARKALSIVAGNFYGNPARELMLLGITGTNGKTTTSFLLEAMCAAAGASTARLGTITYKYNGEEKPATHTTPDALELQRMFREMLDKGTDTVVMEVSSHALAQERVHNLTFRVAGFTNLTRDHLDYHRDMEDYFQSKRKLFAENLSPGGVAVVNGDDTYANRIYNEVRGQKRMAWKFSRLGNAEISATGVEYSVNGIQATLKTPAGDIKIRSALVGAHNLDNILIAAGMALGAGFSRRDVQDGISRVMRVPGRMEHVEGRGVSALIDYAHTDDALRRSLESARTLTKGKLIVVFGCGGDRDKGKRPLMGEAAAEQADIQIVTSDNPRSEDPDEIIGQITPGLEKAGARRISVGKAKAGEKGYLVEGDRSEAIKLAAQLAKPGDLIVIAGKGHETYQHIEAEKKPFDDRAEAEKALAS